MSVATLIKKRRIDLRMTQTQLAKEAKLTPAAISQFESGARKPSFDALSRLAKALRVTTDYLLGKKELGYGDLLADPRMSVMFRGMMELSESDKEAMLEFYEFLKSRKEKKENNQSILYSREGIQIDIAEYINNYEQLRSPAADITVPSPKIVVGNPLRQFRAWLRKLENGESQLPQLPIETFHAGLKWMLEQGEYDKILKLRGKIPEDMAIKGIFLVAKRHIDAALLEQ